MVTEKRETNMKKMAFISRHPPTEKQVALALAQGYELIPVGDRDGFTVSENEFSGYDAVAVVHAAAAMSLAGHSKVIAVFENELRPVVGGKPEFKAKALHLYRIVCNAFAEGIWPVCEKL